MMEVHYIWGQLINNFEWGQLINNFVKTKDILGEANMDRSSDHVWMGPYMTMCIILDGPARSKIKRVWNC